jgi:hypothetical protein
MCQYRLGRCVPDMNHFCVLYIGNVNDFCDSLILARKEAEEEDDKELLDQLTESHLVMTLNDIFFGE